MSEGKSITQYLNELTTKDFDLTTHYLPIELANIAGNPTTYKMNLNNFFSGILAPDGLGDIDIDSNNLINVNNIETNSIEFSGDINIFPMLRVNFTGNGIDLTATEQNIYSITDEFMVMPASSRTDNAPILNKFTGSFYHSSGAGGVTLILKLRKYNNTTGTFINETNLEEWTTTIAADTYTITNTSTDVLFDFDQNNVKYDLFLYAAVGTFSAVGINYFLRALR
jgi:hypothetical protein